jgi:hypothetical protein
MTKMKTTPSSRVQQSPAMPSTIIRQFEISRETIQLLQQLVRYDQSLRIEELNLVANKSSYHYAFATIDAEALKDDEFKEVDAKYQVATVTVYLVPNSMRCGEVWLKHTLVDGEDNKTPWSLTFVFNVGTNNILIGVAVKERVEELIRILEESDFKNMPEVHSWNKRSYKNYKKKYIRQDKVECQFYISEMGPCMYYQHARLKFPTEIEQESRNILADGLKTSLKLVPGRSDVLECLSRFYPETYEQIDKLDYKGEISKDCYPLYNYFETEPSQLEENDDYEDDYDVRYISEDLPDCNLERIKEELRKKYNITDPNF